jgi:hypothetical protein
MELSDIPVVTALITASATFLVGIFAQLASHNLSIRREDRKHRWEVYHTLFAPILFDCYVYFDAATHYRSSHDVVRGSEAKLRTRILTHVGEHLASAPPRLIAAYYRLKRLDYIDEDMSGFTQRVVGVAFFATLVDEAYRLIRALPTFGKEEREELGHYRSLYRIWEIERKLNEDKMDLLIRHKWYFARSRLTSRLYRKLTRFDRSLGPHREFGDDEADRFAHFLAEHLIPDPERRTQFLNILAGSS